MAARILNGNVIAKQHRSKLLKHVHNVIQNGQRPPGLAVILVGDDPASKIYVKHKKRECEEVGFKSEVRNLSATTSEQELVAMIRKLNRDDTVDGILVQTPLPDSIRTSNIIETIDPQKDVDGFHPYNIGRLASRLPALRSCTPKGVMTLLEHTGVELRGLDATIIGASNHVGRPMGLELLLAGCTVTTGHKFSRDIAAHIRGADVLVSAVGKRELIKGEWIKPGAIVIDIGIVKDDHGKLHGDVEFDAAAERAAWITPVPGGVGPMTRVALIENTFQAYRQRQARS